MVIVIVTPLISLILLIARLSSLHFGIFHQFPPGWTTLVLLSLFILGAQVIFMGVLGEYIARILDEVRNRPYYLIDEIIDSDQSTQP